MFIKKDKEMTEKWNDLSIKDKIAIISAVAAFVIGWGLTIAGFIVEPLGEVTESVLWLLGQALIYSASVFGVSAYFNSETVKLKRDIRSYVNKRIKIEEETEDGTE